MIFGSSSFAHRIHNLKNIDLHQRIDETDSNSRDAGCSIKVFGIDHNTSNKKECLDFIDADNGKGMFNPSDLINPVKNIKNEGQIGKFYAGGFDSIMSSNADQVFILSSCLIGENEYIRVFWRLRPRDMRQFVVESLKTKTFEEVNAEVLDKFKPHVVY